MNVETTAMNLSPNNTLCRGNVTNPTLRKTGVVKSASKMMPSVFWDSLGILMIDYLHSGHTINVKYYMYASFIT